MAKTNLISLGSSPLDSLLLEAKMGRLRSRNKLWSLYRPFINHVVSGYVSLAPSMSQFRVDLFNDLYQYFPQIVYDYDFDGKYDFSYFLAELSRKRARLRIRGSYHYAEELIDDDIVENYHDPVDPEVEERDERFRKVMMKLTPSQLKAVSLYYFGRMTQTEAAKELGISQPGFWKRISGAEKKVWKQMKRMEANVQHRKK